MQQVGKKNMILKHKKIGTKLRFLLTTPIWNNPKLSS